MNTACAVFLIEESPSMKTRIAEGTHSRLESIATAVNSAIRQMEGMPSIDVAIIGYHRDADGNPVIGSRWGGPYAGKVWVSSDELAANPIVRKNYLTESFVLRQKDFSALEEQRKAEEAEEV